MTSRQLSLSLFTVVTFFAFVIGCKKTSDDAGAPESTMVYAINGSDAKLTTCIAIEHTLDGSNRLEISALSGSDLNKALSINMVSNGEIKTGFTFNEKSITASGQGTISYAESTGTYLTKTSEDLATSLYDVRITEKTATSVKGTFTAKLYSMDASSETPAYTITKGQFNARIQRQ